MKTPSTYQPAPGGHPAEQLRLEAVVACVGFDDLLDITIPLNHPHLDTLIVVTNHQDRKTQLVCRKHGAICVQTDLFWKNGRTFNKGAAINAGFARFQYHGWRTHLDADVILAPNHRRLLFNHTHLDVDCLYGCDRVDVVGLDEHRRLQKDLLRESQHCWSYLINPKHHRPIGSRYLDPLRGYCPLGFFQMWNAKNQHGYPYSLGTAEHDDIMFADQWPGSQRRHLPSMICYHLCSSEPTWGENWKGDRKQPRLDSQK
jgi:hypothetical protein